ncbi:Diacylglycerol pyrophosphate phosphatase 1 [Cytospora mali]|uniref:Diacylglycerol pyrophosphate phosphatase 1 n=1 Tax=Cytospora mali TaxID=578113 RepID=A0A194VP32_CYTMA|nr:Diacylglycerol pyrophosphate phosphatase 1 [Valsa mali]
MAQEDTNGSVPLIALPSRQQYSKVGDSHNFDTDTEGDIDTSYSPNMARAHIAAQARPRNRSTRSMVMVASSYAFDWAIILVILGVAFYTGNRPPNRRPFFLADPNISFPFTEHEAVPSWLLLVCNAVIPLVVVLVIALIFVPGNTVPKGTPKSLVWKRRLWELHVGWLGLALSLASAWIITNGMKNLFGKPRPDLLSRCNPDMANFSQYVVGGEDVASGFQRLVNASICRGMDREDADEILQDGFRSYPSGHASSAAAGLIYLSLFISSKFAITFPFLAIAQGNNPSTTFSAFPSRIPRPAARSDQHLHAPHNDPLTSRLLSEHNVELASARRQAAAPPIYLLIFAAAPFFTAIYIASSRWYDFRHHGFDILFGFIIGTVCAFFAFRWYHLPISQGAGWAWGPRCSDKAFWAGVGSFSYAMDWEKFDDELSGNDQAAMEEGSAAKYQSTESAGSPGAYGVDSDAASRRRAH